MKILTSFVIVFASIAGLMCMLIGFTLYKGLPDFLDNAINKNGSNGSSQVVEAASITPSLNEEIKKLSKNQIQYFNLSNPEYHSVNEFINKMHSRFNTTVGWGKEVNLDWKKADFNSRKVVVYTNYYLNNKKIKRKSLKDDLTKLRACALTAIKKRDTNAVINEHRYLHDLDKALNHIKSTDTFGVTETYGKGK